MLGSCAVEFADGGRRRLAGAFGNVGPWRDPGAGRGSGWGRPLDGSGVCRAGLPSMSLLHVRVVSPADVRDEVEAILRGQRGATNLVVLPGAAREPSGDLIQADLARECVQKVLSGLRELGLDRRGSISLHAVDMAIGDGVRRAERNAPGAAADAVIWEEVISSTGEDSALTWVFMAFMVLACLLAAIGVATNSPITLVGAMVVGPEFGPLAGIAVGLRLRRMDAVRRGIIALVVGFAGAITESSDIAVLWQAVGLVNAGDLGQSNSSGHSCQPVSFSAI